MSSRDICHRVFGGTEIRIQRHFWLRWLTAARLAAPDMSLLIHVDGISACSPDDCPRAFELDGTYYRIYAVEAQWYRPSGHFFKVRADGKRFIIRHKRNRKRMDST